MHLSALTYRSLIVTLASCWLIGGCSSDDGKGGAGGSDSMSSHADFLSSCAIFPGQCMNYFGTPNAQLEDYNSKNCGDDWAKACPLTDAGDDALGECKDANGGKYFPDGVTGSLIYYETATQTADAVKDACELGGGTWLAEYVP
jgi:hypothetical protein